LSILFVLQAAIRIVRKVRPFPIPPAVGILILDNPLRKRLLSSEEIVRRIGIEPGQKVLEVGAGTGYVALDAARAVGPQGQVTALDIEPRMIERMRQNLLVEGIGNVEGKLGDAAKLDVPDETFDCVYFVTSLGEMPDKQAALWEAYRVLRPAGTLSVSEVVTDPDYMLKGTVIRLGEEAGFYLTEEHGSFLAYTVNFRKPSRRVTPG
jgi:ubiquinone/menaquinone biosynthesis C-methylase UbiE